MRTSGRRDPRSDLPGLVEASLALARRGERQCDDAIGREMRRAARERRLDGRCKRGRCPIRERESATVVELSCCSNRSTGNA